MMKKSSPTILTMITAICVLILLTICSCSGKTGARIELPDGVLSPCDLREEQVGEHIVVGGEIAFVDDTEPDALYADLEIGNCRVGISVFNRDFQSWSNAEQDSISIESQIVVEGRLSSFPMPARPDEYQLVVEVSTPPQILSQAAAQSAEAVRDDLCRFPEQLMGEDIASQGILLIADDSAGAGIYGELDTGNCVAKLWIERTRWDTWKVEEQLLFSEGNEINVVGILTDVLHEHTIDLSLPPTLIGE